jgi:hypothetical protein
MSSKDLEYYKEQLQESSELLAKDPGNKDLEALVESLAEMVRKNEAEDDPGFVGKTCEVYCEDKWYNAVVVSTRIDESMNEKIIVKLMGTEQAREYDVKDVKFLAKAAKDDFPIDTRVQAIWNEDGLWYNGKIVAAPDAEAFQDGFHVVYDGFDDGIPYLVKSDQVRKPIKVPRPQKSDAAKADDQKSYVTPAGYVIPENLKIDPSKDSEKIIEDKKRKIHHLKSQQRQDKYTEEITHNKSQWQQFQQKMKSRR